MRPIDGDALVKYCNGNPFITDSVKTYIRLSVATMPTIEERKTGKWIDGKCNKCGTHAPYWAMASTYYLSEYCPSCGARMVQEGEDNDG